LYLSAHVLGCSTGGQTNNNGISDDEIVAIAESSRFGSIVAGEPCSDERRSTRA